MIVETAYPLSNPVRERIVGRLTQLLGRQVILTTEVNEDLLGGLVVRVGDTVYDASLAARLKRMEASHARSNQTNHSRIAGAVRGVNLAVTCHLSLVICDEQMTNDK